MGGASVMNLDLTAFTFDAAIAPLFCGLAVAVALLWWVAFFALQVAQRTGGSDRVCAPQLARLRH